MTHTPEFLAHFPAAYGRYRSHQPDHSRCCVSVSDGSRIASYYQCSRKNGHGADGAYCKAHDPVAVKAKREARYAEYSKKLSDAGRERTFATNCQDAIRSIAAGHNDPRGLAQSIIDKLENGK